jgi:glycerol-3-phosphate responsive antiterminator
MVRNRDKKELIAGLLINTEADVNAKIKPGEIALSFTGASGHRGLHHFWRDGRNDRTYTPHLRLKS